MKKVFLASVLLLALASPLAWFVGRPAYRHQKESRAAAQAIGFLARGDYRNASISARQALLVNPANLDACLVMAQLADVSLAPQALDWRRRIAELAPTVENKLKLASTALRVQRAPYSLTTQILGECAAEAADLTQFHVLSAELALKLNRPSEAESHFVTAGRLDPTNSLYRLNLAVLRLGSTNEARAAESRAILQEACTDASVACAALRWLIADDLRRNLPADALACSRRLLANPWSSLDDRLQHLQILRDLGDPGFEAALKSVRDCATTNAAATYAAVSWMASHNLASQALEFLASCPASIADEQPVPLARVECYLATKKWGDLEGFLERQKWGDLEFMRQAFLARVAAEQKDGLTSDVRWRLAVRQASDRLGPLISLLTMAAAWGREGAREDLLWKIAQTFPRERWALRELDSLYTAAGNTRGLHKMYGVLAARDPNNWAARNNFAATAMLLNLDLSKAHEAARELYAQRPADPVITSTYAWSLHLQGQNRQALAVMEKLDPKSIANPPLALYYGLLLAADCQTNRAAEYLARARNASLLPEEKRLAAEAIRD